MVAIILASVPRTCKIQHTIPQPVTLEVPPPLSNTRTHLHLRHHHPVSTPMLQPLLLCLLRHYVSILTRQCCYRQLWPTFTTLPAHSQQSRYESFWIVAVNGHISPSEPRKPLLSLQKATPPFYRCLWLRRGHSETTRSYPSRSENELQPKHRADAFHSAPHL